MKVPSKTFYSRNEYADSIRNQIEFVSKRTGRYKNPIEVSFSYEEIFHGREIIYEIKSSAKFANTVFAVYDESSSPRRHNPQEDGEYDPKGEVDSFKAKILEKICSDNHPIIDEEGTLTYDPNLESVENQ